MGLRWARALGLGALAGCLMAAPAAPVWAAGTAKAAPPHARGGNSGAVSRPAAAPAPGVKLPPVPKGTVVVANDGILRMAVNMHTGWFQIVDERNGAVWNSGPPDPSLYAQNTHWQNILQSDFTLGRTTTERSNVEQDLSAVGVPDDGGQVTVHRIPNGVALDYNYTLDNIQFQGDLTISGAHLTATVPWSSVKEKNCPRFTPPPPHMALILFYFPPECYEVVDIHFLPALGYGVPGEPGYSVIPDGSGAIVDYAKDHPIYTVDYNMPVYGDPTIPPGLDEWYPEANMPIFGQVHLDPSNPAGNAAMLGIIQTGAAQSDVIMIPAGRQANLYLTSVRFTYRPLFTEFLAGSLQNNSRYAWHPLPGNRQASYYFLAGPNATYAGIALRYRQYLIQTQHVQPLKPKPSAPFLLEVLNGARETGVLFDPLEVATTFAQTQQMIQSLEAQGVRSLRVTLEGWMLNGIDWKSLPYIWPPDGAFGGTGGLERLDAWGSAHHAPIVLALNLYLGYKNGLGFSTRYGSVHFEDQLPMIDPTLLNLTGYLISANIANQRLFPPLLADAERVGAAGMDFEYLARDVYPNYQKGDVLSRSQSAAQWMDMVSAARKHLGTAGVQGGNLYALGHANYFYQAPTTDSGFDYESQAIPLWEMVVHGLALYSGTAVNLQSDPVQQRLQMIEDGALPVWELTWRSADALRYAPEYNFLYSSQFSQWEPAAVAEYKQELASGYSSLAYVAMTNNFQVAPGVFETDYANGAKVIVNFNRHAVTLPQLHDTVVAAQNYVVLPGGAS
jgi:hypothetical protein